MWQTSKWENIPAHLFALENVGKECSAGTLPNVLWAGEAKKKTNQTKNWKVQWHSESCVLGQSQLYYSIQSSGLPLILMRSKKSREPTPVAQEKCRPNSTIRESDHNTPPPPCINIHMPWKRRGSLHQHKIYSISPGWILMIRLIKSSLTTDSGQEIIIYSPAGLQLAIALHPHDFYSLSSACLIVLLILQQCAHPHNDLQWCQ